MGNNPKSTTGGEIGLQTDEFRVHNAAHLITFDLDDTTPPNGFYVELNDNLLFTGFQEGAGNNCLLVVRMLTVDGEIRILPFTIGLANVRTVTNKLITLPEGYILSATVLANGGVGEAGYLWVELSIVRQPQTIAGAQVVLCSGYVTNTQPLSFPGSGVNLTVNGPGFYSSLTQAAPAAGAEIIYTVPTSLRQRLVTFSASLTTSAVAGTRSPSLVIDDGANIVAQIPSQGAQITGTTATYTWGDSMAVANNAAGANIAPLPGQTILPAGFRVRTLTTGILAGDQWSAAFMLSGRWQGPV